jgi:serine/threonine protein kinase
MSGDKPTAFGEYRVTRKIGRGGFGSVYLAENSLFPGRSFAIKVFNAGDDEPDGFAPLRDELANLIGLSHTNIVQVRGFGVEVEGKKSDPYIVMDYIEGPNGGSYNLKQHLIASGGRIPVVEVKRIFRQILSALGLVHKKQIAHLDLKPENILLDRDLNAYVSDFGISQSVTSHSLRADRPPTIHGFSPVYASPEQIRHQYGSRHSDIFSLGVMLLECLTGKRPEVLHSSAHPKVEYTPPSSEGMDRKWDQLMERCLSIDPAYRFPNAEIFLRALEQMPSTPAGAERDMARIVEQTARSAPISVTTPRSSTRPTPSTPPFATTPMEGRMSKLLVESRSTTARSPREAERKETRELAPHARFSIKVMSICGVIAGLIIGVFLGMNEGDIYGRSHSQQMGRVLGLFLGQDLGGWAGREFGTLIGALFGGVIGTALGWATAFGLGHFLFRAVSGHGKDQDE